MKILTIQRIGFIRTMVLLLFVLSICKVSAQKMQHEFSINAGGGWAAHTFQPGVKTASSVGFGADAGVGFTGFISPHWGIHVGVGAGIFNIKNSISNFMFVVPDLNDCGYLYNLHTTLNDYRETHKAIFLNVPLMFQFQTKMNQSAYWIKDKKAGFYAMAGAKAQFLINNNYTSTIASLNNAAYYPEFENWIYSEPGLGLGVFNDVRTSGKINFGMLAMLAVETGAKWRIGQALFLYTGVYFDYGLNDPTKGTRKTPESFVLPSSGEANNVSLLKFTNKIHPMAAGLKLRLAFAPAAQPSKKERCPYNPYPPYKKRSITLKNTETYTYCFVDHVALEEERWSIKVQAQHYEISELVRDESTNMNWEYHYKPKAGYVGKDQVILEIYMKTAEGEEFIDLQRIDFKIQNGPTNTTTFIFPVYE